MTTVEPLDLVILKNDAVPLDVAVPLIGVVMVKVPLLSVPKAPPIVI